MKIIPLISNFRSSKYLLFFGLLHLLFLPLALLGRGTLELPFNLFVAPELFSTFNIITFLGDGLFAIVVFVLVGIFAKLKGLKLKNEFINFLIVSALMGLSIFVFKNLFFSDITRPIAHFTTLQEGWNTADFKLTFHRFRSFPSGHSSSAATYGFFLMRYFEIPYQRVLLYIAVLLVGYSRVFLFQHFVADVYVGVLLGLLCVWIGDVLTQWIFEKNTKING